MKGSSAIPVIDMIDKIKHQAQSGGTNTSLVFGYAEKTGVKYDRIIILSDQESWKEGWGGGSPKKAYELYRKNTGNDPYVYAIDIEGYGSHDIVGGKVFHLTGWSDRLFDFMAKVEEGESLIDYIKNYEL